MKYTMFKISKVLSIELGPQTKLKKKKSARNVLMDLKSIKMSTFSML